MTEEEREWGSLWLQKHPVRPGQRRAVVHVGGASPSKIWPLERYRELLVYLGTHGFQVIFEGSVISLIRAPQSRKWLGS